MPSKSVAERIYDLEDETIKLKFHREKDRILCQTVSSKLEQIVLHPIYFYQVEMGRPSEGQRTVGEEDVSVYVVDPREEGPDLKELQKLYKAQVEHQAVAISRVKVGCSRCKCSGDKDVSGDGRGVDDAGSAQDEGRVCY